MRGCESVPRCAKHWGQSYKRTLRHRKDDRPFGRSRHRLNTPQAKTPRHNQSCEDQSCTPSFAESIRMRTYSNTDTHVQGLSSLLWNAAVVHKPDTRVWLHLRSLFPVLPGHPERPFQDEGLPAC
jgi:hypothetical protein